MKRLSISIASLLCATSLLVGGCNDAHNKMQYTVTCYIDRELAIDTLTMLVLESDYHQLRSCGTVVRMTNGFSSFEGQIDEPRLALLRWNHQRAPFYFVLEAGNTTIHIRPTGWSISGSPQCRTYQAFLNKRQAIIDARLRNNHQYLALMRDSTLTADDEAQLHNRDEQLRDSLQSLLLKQMCNNDVVATIVKQRFVNELDSVHLQRLNQCDQ